MELMLKELRKKNRITQEQLAEMVGATKRKIGAWERGENDIPMDYAVSIADALECSVDELAGRLSRVYSTQLNWAERQLVSMYRSMDAEGRNATMEYAAYQAERHPSDKGTAAEV
ncbi:MAG TPA: hypothetical protein DCP91_02715 [Eggerthellaceae bacterium]|nr:hypothetical protein [Eggerthellaceae bacterium]